MSCKMIPPQYAGLGSTNQAQLLPLTSSEIPDLAVITGRYIQVPCIVRGEKTFLSVLNINYMSTGLTGPLSVSVGKQK
jgi:hypothetical protein